MSSTPSFYWFDYETFGRSPVWDHPAQFAGRRTDMDLNPIGKPEVIYCRLPGDYLPEPGACRITGITPSKVMQEGLVETDFIARVVAQLGAADTVSVGFNSIRFDDEFTRHTLHRNLAEPYAHQWRNGCSRWDLIDVLRLTRALRPDGIEWPVGEHGRAVNRLESFTAANGIDHAAAHDALSDVDATIGVARLLKRQQPRLFEYAFTHRSKSAVAEQLNLRDRKLQLYCTSSIPGERHHLAAVVPICRLPTRSNDVIVLDLDTEPALLRELDVDELKRRIFATRDQLGDTPRVGLRSIKLNACPVLAPFNALRPADAERLGMSREGLMQRREELIGMLDSALIGKVEAVMTREYDDDPPDPDGSLYAGGFLSDADRRRLDGIRNTPPEQLVGAEPTFDDARLTEMVWRYRARNWPESLTVDERARWQQHVQERLTRDGAPWQTLATFRQAMHETDWSRSEASLREDLLAYCETLAC